MRHSGTAASTSRIECCFMNTVDAQMSSAMTHTANFTHGYCSFRQSSRPNIAATEPRTCIDGQTFVFVSKV